MLAKDKVERISYEVIKTLYSRFESFPENALNNRNAPFHEAFLNAFKDHFNTKVSDIPFFISLSSWLHGLNTTLGQSFFERTSHILSEGIKKEFKGLKISAFQQEQISDIIINLKNKIATPSIEKENKLLFTKTGREDKDTANFTVDCFFEDELKIIAIELKTVKPNSGTFKNEKEKILCAKAALKNIFPNKEILFYLGFPFDPLSKTSTGYDKNLFMNYSVDFKKFFDSSEILLASELWNFLSGESNTMEELLNIINKIATPQFKMKYELLNNPTNKQSNLKNYLEYLNDWNLFSEIELINKEIKLLEKIKGNNRNMRIFNQPIFKKGEYNIERFYKFELLLNDITI